MYGHTKKVFIKKFGGGGGGNLPGTKKLTKN